jgi:hypothetical protein
LRGLDTGTHVVVLLNDRAQSITGSATKQSLDLPVLFISHLYSDSSIADALRYFLATRSGGQIRVIQSSPATRVNTGATPDPSTEKMRGLRAAEAVVLIYTGHSEDLSYCMWEVGIATATISRNPTTVRVLAFDEAPPPGIQR